MNFFLLIVLPLIFIGCQDDATIEVSDIQLSSNSIQIEKNHPHTLSATILPQDATNQEIIWSSSDNTIASVNNGDVVGLKNGVCSIFVETKDGKIKKECKVEIIPVKVIGVSFDENTCSFLYGKPFKMNYYIIPNDAENKKVIISSSDQNIVSINSDGTLQANNIGEALITLKTEDGGHAASHSVSVVDITSMVSLSFLSSSVVNRKGYITGEICFAITNNSGYDIELTKYSLMDSESGTMRQWRDNVNVLLKAGENYEQGGKHNECYLPKVTWSFKHDGKEYSVSCIWK